MSYGSSDLVTVSFCSVGIYLEIALSHQIPENLKGTKTFSDAGSAVDIAACTTLRHMRERACTPVNFSVFWQEAIVLARETPQLYGVEILQYSA